MFAYHFVSIFYLKYILGNYSLKLYSNPGSFRSHAGTRRHILCSFFSCMLTKFSISCREFSLLVVVFFQSIVNALVNKNIQRLVLKGTSKEFLQSEQIAVERVDRCKEFEPKGNIWIANVHRPPFCSFVLLHNLILVNNFERCSIIIKRARTNADSNEFCNLTVAFNRCGRLKGLP